MIVGYSASAVRIYMPISVALSRARLSELSLRAWENLRYFQQGPRKEDNRICNLYPYPNSRRRYPWYFFVHFFGGSTGAVYYWTIMCGARHSITTVAKSVNNVKMNRHSLDRTREKFKH